MKQYDYQLQKYTGPKTRYACPRCGQRGRFTRYVATATGQQVAEHVGRCDRQDSCGYHLSAWDYLRDQRALAKPVRPVISSSAFLRKAISDRESRESGSSPHTVQQAISYMPDWMASSTFVNFRNNNFVQWLYTLGYDRALVNRRILQYRIGTSERWEGASIWWQRDAQQRYRTGKVMLYDRATGHRVKEPYAHIAWMHKEMGEGFTLGQCLYGEHLLAWWDETAQIGIVESEKTAVVASLEWPHILWMATGGKEGITADKLLPLRGRSVILYPDHGGYELWSKKARDLRHTLRMEVSDMVEREGEAGWDIVDWMVSARQG